MGRCYLCQQVVEPSNDATLLIAVIGALYGLDHVAKTFSAMHLVVEGDPQITILELQKLEDIPHAHIYPVNDCKGSPKAIVAAEKYSIAYKVVKLLPNYQ